MKFSRWMLLRRCGVVVTLSALVLACSAAAWSQTGADSGTTDSAAASVTSDETPDEVPEAVMAPGAMTPVVDDSDRSALERVDGAFQVAVHWMEKVLFARLFSTEREYIVVERAEYFLRERGTQTPFRSVSLAPLYPDGELDNDEVRTLAAQGRLVTDSSGRNFRFSRVKEQPIEFVTVTFDHPDRKIPYGTKYVLRDDGMFHRILPMRGAISADDVLSRTEVDELADEGWLRAEASDAAPGGVKYIFTESVGGAPIVVLWLSAGAVFFTIYMGFFNVWGFRHAVEVVRGKYDNPDEDGEVTHFQALASALSATVGLGNIAGVTIAMTMGGPGAFFWMVLCGVFGMTSKFTECTLGQRYRLVKPDGTILGGPMRYLRAGLAELNLAPLGAALSVIFAVMCVLASFGGGNMFQANQSGQAVLAQLQRDDRDQLRDYDRQIKAAAQQEDVEAVKQLQGEKKDLENAMNRFSGRFSIGYGLILAAMVAVVIIGGIRRIGAAASKIVPTMCLLYVAACLWIILSHIGQVPALIADIFTEAFNSRAMGGGMLGVLVVGVQRAAFSNEAGVGSAAIAHSAAKTEEPIREGAVALLGPFIDTVIVCSMTALVILITGAWDNSAWIVDQGLAGAALTSEAFKSEISWFPWVLSIAVVLFAYSTIISWSYYGERASESLFGPRAILPYKVLTVLCVFAGAVFNAGAVLDFSDMMILSMAFPNILGVVLLAPKVKADLQNYWTRYRAGEFRTFK